MDVELSSGISSSFDHPALERDEEKKEITETCVKANKFFKDVMNRYSGNDAIVNWARESHKNLRKTLSERFMSSSSSVSDDLGKCWMNVNHSK